MNVFVKKFDVGMEVKKNGIEFDVADTKGAHLGDLILTQTKLIWRQGRTQRDHGKPIKWADFIEFMNSRE